MGDRIKRFAETAEQTIYFFTESFPWDEKAVRKRLMKVGAADLLVALRTRLAAADPFDAPTLEVALHDVATEKGVGVGEMIHPVRVAVSGRATGPGLFDLLTLLGRDCVLRRIDRALEGIRDRSLPGSA
jgi:glutamyl/glutaminyl-tRNA synthetase